VVKLWAQSDEQGLMAGVTLQQLIDLSFITSPVQAVAATTEARKVFQMMADKHLSGLAVVNEEGKLIHNTSATDIKLWLMAGSEALDEQIEQFLATIRKQSVIERYPVTMCLPTDTLKRAVGKLQATKYHRMWVIQEDSTPIGVFALTDVFRFVCAKDGDDSKVEKADEKPMTVHKRPKDDHDSDEE